MNTRRLTLASILTAVALIIHIIEAQIPLPIAIPGIKLGLANVITLVSLYMLGKRDTFFILIIRITLGSIFAGQMLTFFYSLAGGMLCYIVLCIFQKMLSADKIWAVSIFGAIAHNIGQIASAIIITGTLKILWYLPFLMIAAILTGCFTGFCGKLLISCLEKTKLGK